MTDASKLKEDSDEFQNVVKEFYDTIQDYHNKIKIIKVRLKTLCTLMCSCVVEWFCLWFSFAKPVNLLSLLFEFLKV